MKTIRRLITLFVMLASVSTQAIYAKSNYHYLYVFGDSLTDNGNLYAMTYYRKPSPLPNPKEYYQGRFSNGLVWVEYLAPMMNLPTSHVINVAYGGAKAGMGNANDTDAIHYPGLDKEVTLFIAQHHKKTLDNKHALYIIWNGADNFLGKVDNPKQAAKAAATGIANAIVRLKARSGAKHFMLINIPFLGFTPRMLALDKNKPGISKQFNTLIGFTNKLYQQQARRLAKRLDVSITYVNTNTLFLDLIHHPKKYGFSNVTQSCYALQKDHECKDPNQFLFWGTIHPTTKTHRIIAKWIDEHYL